jgi:hypothetical protein
MGASAGTLHNYESSDQEASTMDEDLSDGTSDSQQMGKIIITSAGVAFFFIAMTLAFRFTKKELQKVRRGRHLVLFSLLCKYSVVVADGISLSFSPRNSILEKAKWNPILAQCAACL